MYITLIEVVRRNMKRWAAHIQGSDSHNYSVFLMKTKEPNHPFKEARTYVDQHDKLEKKKTRPFSEI